MKKKIFKYEILLVGLYEINLPIGAHILSVSAQDGDLFIWVLVDPMAGLERRCFEWFATGEDIRCDIGIDREYIDTVYIADGRLVYHLFERFN